MKVMILGANAHQVRAIQRTQEMGHIAVAVDNRLDSPGKQVADETAFASTFDADACIDAAKGLKVEGVFTSGTDQPVLTAAVIQEALRLPKPFSVGLARRLTNKHWMKRHFDSCALPTLPWALIGKGYEEEEVSFSFPAVMKPVDSQGQRGIFLVGSHKEIRSHLDECLSYSREEQILLEPYYESDEVTVSGWVKDGETTILSITDRETFRSKGQLGICLSHENPTRFVETLGDELESLTFRIVSAFEIENGPIYFQFLIGDNGVVINEIAGRIGGAHEDYVLPRTTGFDLLGNQVRISLGEEIANTQFTEWRKPPLRSSVQLFFVEPCTIDQIVLPKADALASLMEVGLHIHEGQRLESIDNATARAGYAIFISESETTLQQDVEKFYNQMQIFDASGRNRIIKHSRRDRL